MKRRKNPNHDAFWCSLTLYDWAAFPCTYQHAAHLMDTPPEEIRREVARYPHLFAIIEDGGPDWRLTKFGRSQTAKEIDALEEAALKAAKPHRN